jgi:ubiquinone/menaquinone biosynthesis C-methylase UbiE
MSIAENILYRLARWWPSPVEKTHSALLGRDASSAEYHLNYALHKQFLEKARGGMGFAVYDKRILEIGCGHGGISVFLGLNGAKEVVGIDLNTTNLGHAEAFKRHLEQKFGMSRPIPVAFLEMDAGQLDFATDCFDVIIADNVFEHFIDAQRVMQEAQRVLKPGGLMIVPAFNSIYSKYGLHLKHGLKMPWANVFFSEKTICRVMLRLASDRAELYTAYPGLKNKPTKVKDLRAYGDLNGMTHRRFLADASASGFHVSQFQIVPPFGNPFANALVRVLYRIPLLNRSLLADVLSKKAIAVLKKP